MADQLPSAQVILVVEDEEVVRGLIRRILEAEGYTVVEARDGAEALRLCTDRPDEPIDLLLTDLVIPELTGPELAASLRSFWPDLSVLWMSGYAEGTSAQVGRMPPNTEFIQKPFAPAELVRRVQGLLRGQAAL